MARTTRGRKGSHTQAQASQTEEATPAETEAEDPRATAVATAPARAEPVSGSTIVGMPRDPGAEEIDDAQAAHITPPVSPGKERDGNATEGPAIGKRAPSKEMVIGKSVNAAGMQEDDEGAYDQETTTKYEQVKRSLSCIWSTCSG